VVLPLSLFLRFLVKGLCLGDGGTVYMALLRLLGMGFMGDQG
jgi:hypothetical protein